MRTLFLVLDTVRRDYLEAYGNDWVKTPNLRRLAERCAGAELPPPAIMQSA